MSSRIEISPAALRAWVERLNPDGDPDFGSHGIIICPETGEVFPNKEATKAYTAKTGITEFAILWVKVDRNSDGGWSVQPRQGNKPPTGKEKVDEDEERQRLRIVRQQQNESRMTSMFESTLNAVESDIRSKEAEEAAATAALLASKAERERIEQERLERLRLEQEAQQAAEQARLEARIAEREKERIRVEALKERSNTEEKMPSHKKIFGVWVNDKLVKAGFDPIKIKNLEFEFQDGTILAKLLEALTGRKIEGIDWKPGNPLQVAANFHILWAEMTRVEGIDLGGVNASNVMRDPPMLKTLLALLWHLIQKYEFADEGSITEALLQWVQPRTQSKKPVGNFTSDWVDGMAFLALFDSLVPGQIDFAKVQASSEEDRLNMAFGLFLKHLGVPKLLDSEDLEGSPDVDMKQGVMTYVAAIRNAVSHADDGADKLFNDANGLYVQALLDGRTTEEDLFQDAKSKIRYSVYGDDNEVDVIIADAIRGLSGCNERFIATKEAFEHALETYLAMNSEQGAEMSQMCREKIADTIKQSDILTKKLRDGLLHEKLLWKIKVEIEEGDIIVAEIDSVMDGLVSQIAQWAETEVAKTRGEDERVDLKNKATAIVEKKAEPLMAAKAHYQAAYDLTVDAVIKRQCTKKIEEIQDILDVYNQQALDVVNAAIFDNESNKKAEAEDILNIYHDFSQRIDSLSQKKKLEDAELSRVPGVADARLETILRRISSDYKRAKSLREQLHIAFDETFTIERLP
jgi:uncharacterized protein YfkK (UPF0435 family)